MTHATTRVDEQAVIGSRESRSAGRSIEPHVFDHGNSVSGGAQPVDVKWLRHQGGAAKE